MCFFFVNRGHIFKCRDTFHHICPSVCIIKYDCFLMVLKNLMCHDYYSAFVICVILSERSISGTRVLFF